MLNMGIFISCKLQNVLHMSDDDNTNTDHDASYDSSHDDYDDAYGLDITTTEDIEVPEMLIDQVIGQEHAVEIIKKAAKQRRHVLMIGTPGTGKSMLAKAISELLPKEELEDVLVYHNMEDGNNPVSYTHLTLPTKRIV